MKLNEEQQKQEELVHTYKYNALALLGLLFGALSFFAFNTIFAPLGLLCAFIAFFAAKASLSVPALVISGFGTFFMLMQTFSGGFLLTN